MKGKSLTSQQHKDIFKNVRVAKCVAGGRVGGSAQLIGLGQRI